MDLADQFKDLTKLELNSDLLKGVTDTLDSLNQKQEEQKKEEQKEPKEGETQGETKDTTKTAVQTDDGTIRAANAELDKALEIDKNLDASLTLKDVVAPTTMAETAIKQMESVDMSKIIGTPMNAAVQAQFDASRKMLECIKEIGVKDNTLATVTFNFFKSGKKAVMTVPLLTLVPINAMRIKELTYAFKLKIDTESSVNLQTGVEKSVSYGNNAGGGASSAKGGDMAAKGGEGGNDKKDSAKTLDAIKSNVHGETTFATSFSSKKDSRATQNSKYNVETTMDINMTIAPEESQPAGISKMLEILNNTIDVHNPNGELSVDSHRVTLVNGVAVASVTYINGDGLYAPGKVTCKLSSAKDDKIRVLAMDNGDKVDLIFVEEGLYTISAEKLQTYVIVEKPEVKQAKATEEVES